MARMHPCILAQASALVQNVLAWQRSGRSCPGIYCEVAVGFFAMTEVAALFSALQQLTTQVQMMAEKGGAGQGKRWDTPERYKNLKVFDGNLKDFEEWGVKFRSLVCAGDAKVGQLMKAVEHECTEDELVKNKYTQTAPEFDESDGPFILQTSAEMYNLLLNITTGEANAVVRRSLGLGWLAWKRLTSSLNPRTLASGIKAISAVLTPPRVTQAAKADQVLDEWEDKLVKLNVEYGQELSNKVKVAVLYAMMPKDLQEKVLDACAVNWDETTEGDAGKLYNKVKSQLRNLAKARREMQGPKPMEVDRVSAWADCSGDWGAEWGIDTEAEESHNHDDNKGHEEAYVQFIGKGGGKKGGKGFQGHCYTCGAFGHSQWDCRKGKGKGKDGGYATGFGKDTGFFKGFGKDYNYAKGYGKGKDGWYSKGKGNEYSKGGAAMQRACFGCGSTEHLLKDCPKNPARVQQVEDETPEILFIGNVQDRAVPDEWKRVPMKITMGDFMKDKVKAPIVKKKGRSNRFKVLEVDEDDSEDPIVHVRAVEFGEDGADQPWWLDTPSIEEDMRASKDYTFGGTGGAGEAPHPCTHKNSTVQGKEQYEIESGMASMREDVQYVRAVCKDDGWLSLGKGDIVVDSAADESCWPAGQGDAFPTKPSGRKMMLKTANGGDMNHFGQKEVIFRYEGGKEVMGLTFQVTDVKKPLLAVRRLVEKGNKVVLSAGDGESFIQNLETKVKVPIKKKGGSFVIEAHFVKKAMDFARRA